MVQVQRFNSAHHFAKYALNYLYENEALNNLPIGILNRCMDKEDRNEQIEDPPYLAMVTQQQEPILFLIMTPPYNIGVFGDPTHPALEEAILKSIEVLIEEDIEIPGVIGQRRIADKFAEVWANHSGSTYEMAMDQCIYKLTEVKDLPRNSGYLRLATMKDLDLISEWTYAFSFVTESPFSKEMAKQKAEQFINDRSIYLWIDGEPVSMARKARGTVNGMSINMVYTPKDQTRKGYATSCVAELSKSLIAEGYSYCTLYTDLSNPTSNSIYQKIGYEPIGDSIVYRFRM